MDATKHGTYSSWSTTRQPHSLRLLSIEREEAELVEQRRRIEIGQRMKQRREELLLTQEDVARAVDTSTRQYQRWEGGQGTDRANYERIAGVLKLSMNELLYGSEEPAAFIPSGATGDALLAALEQVQEAQAELTAAIETVRDEQRDVLALLRQAQESDAPTKKGTGN